MARPDPASNFPSSYLRTLLLQIQDKTTHGIEYLSTAFAEWIPGLRYSAAFLSTLRQNLQLSLALDPPPPPPGAMPTHPAPATAPSPDQTPLPPLTTYATTAPAETLAALKLIADSIAQQRQLASRLLISHPLFLALAFAVLALVAQSILGQAHGTWALVGTTWAGCVMAMLVGVRWMSGGYLERAEGVGWGFLTPVGGEEGEGEGPDIVVVSRYGEVVIGCVVVRVVGTGEKEKGKGRRRGGGAGRKALLRAWTVGLRWRGRGVGKGVLEEAVRVAVGERGCEDVVFADVHAHSGRVLPRVFNGGFDRREARARKTLQQVVEAQKVAGRKR